MGFETPTSKYEIRALKVRELLRDGADFYTAVKKVLTNEGITHPPDVKRAMSEIGKILAKGGCGTEEEFEAAWQQKIAEEHEQIRREQTLSDLYDINDEGDLVALDEMVPKVDDE